MTWHQDAVQDLRIAFRNIRRRPGFALAVIAVLGIGIGAATAVFSVVDRVLMRALPYQRPESLVSIGITLPWLDFDFLTDSSYVELRRDLAPLRAVTAWSRTSECDLTGERPVRLTCARVDPTFLGFLGVRPQVGRDFAADEDRVVLITYSLWQNRFGGERAIAGRKIELDGRPAEIVGVLPRDFELPTLDRVDILLPLARPANLGPGSRPLRVYGRLGAGVTIARAREVLNSRAPQLLVDLPPAARTTVKIQVRTLRELRQGDSRTTSLALFGAVLGVLLIACANVANLLLARSMARSRELAVRVALGAGRWRIARQVLAETLLLSLAGGVAGCGMARLLLWLFAAVAPAGIPQLAWATLDLRVLAFGLAAGVVCGVLVAVAPAWRTPRSELLTGARTTGPSRLWARHALVAVQLAASLVLLTVSGLLLRSLWNRQSLSLGVKDGGVVTAEMVLGPRYARQAQRLNFYEQLLTRVQGLPGVEAAGLADTLPPAGVPRSHPRFSLEVEGQAPAPESANSGIILWRSVTPGYFRALGIPVLSGRTFVEDDRGPEGHPVVLSATLARSLFGVENPVGRRLRRFRTPKPLYTVVGVVGDVRNGGLTDRIDPEYYVIRGRSTTSYDDAPMNSALVVKSAGSAGAMERWVRAEIAGLDPALPAVVGTFREHLGEVSARPHFQAVLLSLFAGIGVLMAAIGLYALISFTVEQRRREIGVRLALGATGTRIAGMIAATALGWTLCGVLAGLAGSVAAARSIRGLLFHVPAVDPISFSGAALLLVALAALAAVLPCRRAAVLDPLRVLREE